MVNQLPGLVPGAYQATSPKTNRYNCIAWAAQDDQRWWWPLPASYYWPPDVAREETLTAFVAAYQTLGYEPCNDGQLEAGWERVAIYANVQNGLLVPTHAARQLPTGSWTSKLGQNIDIEHVAAATVEGPAYGQVVQFMRRPNP